MSDCQHLIAIGLGALQLVVQLRFHGTGCGVGLDNGGVEARVEDDALESREDSQCGQDARKDFE
jgi:hypothetical protein